MVELGQYEHAPQAVAQLVGELLIDVTFRRAQTLFNHYEFHQIPDIADETLGDFFAGPRPSGLLGFFGGKARAKLHCAVDEIGEVYGLMIRGAA